MNAAALLLALGLAAGAADDGADAAAPLRLRNGLRVEADAASGWSDDTFVAVGGRAALRFDPIVLSAGGMGVPHPSARREGFELLLAIGVGAVRDVGAWEAEGSLLLGFHDHRWPDPYGAGPAEGGGPALGLRLGVSRALPVGALRIQRRGGIVPLVSLAATVAWSGRAEYRARGAETDGFVALLSLGLGAALQRL